MDDLNCLYRRAVRRVVGIKLAITVGGFPDAPNGSQLSVTPLTTGTAPQNTRYQFYLPGL